MVSKKKQIKDIEKEINKCRLLCCKCHRLHTMKQFNYTDYNNYNYNTRLEKLKLTVADQ